MLLLLLVHQKGLISLFSHVRRRTIYAATTFIGPLVESTVNGVLFFVIMIIMWPVIPWILIDFLVLMCSSGLIAVVCLIWFVKRSLHTVIVNDQTTPIGSWHRSWYLWSLRSIFKTCVCVGIFLLMQCPPDIDVYSAIRQGSPAIREKARELHKTEEKLNQVRWHKQSSYFNLDGDKSASSASSASREYGECGEDGHEIDGILTSCQIEYVRALEQEKQLEISIYQQKIKLRRLTQKYIAQIHDGGTSSITGGGGGGGGGSGSSEPTYPVQTWLPFPWLHQHENRNILANQSMLHIMRGVEWDRNATTWIDWIHPVHTSPWMYTISPSNCPIDQNIKSLGVAIKRLNAANAATTTTTTTEPWRRFVVSEHIDSCMQGTTGWEIQSINGVNLVDLPDKSDQEDTLDRSIDQQNKQKTHENDQTFHNYLSVLLHENDPFNITLIEPKEKHLLQKLKALMNEENNDMFNNMKTFPLTYMHSVHPEVLLCALVFILMDYRGTRYFEYLYPADGPFDSQRTGTEVLMVRLTSRFWTTMLVVLALGTFYKTIDATGSGTTNGTDNNEVTTNIFWWQWWNSVLKFPMVDDGLKFISNVLLSVGGTLGVVLEEYTSSFSIIHYWGATFGLDFTIVLLLALSKLNIYFTCLYLWCVLSDGAYPWLFQESRRILAAQQRRTERTRATAEAREERFLAAREQASELLERLERDRDAALKNEEDFEDSETFQELSAARARIQLLNIRRTTDEDSSAEDEANNDVLQVSLCWQTATTVVVLFVVFGVYILFAWLHQQIIF